MQTIYVENDIREHTSTTQILGQFPKSRVIAIDRYSEVFNPKSQNFRIQKQNPALILARKHKNHVLSAPPDYNIGGDNNYYFSHMMNCIYDCRYCFLQGMYSSANYVVFVNHQDFFSEIQRLASENQNPSWFFSGYDCDSLALEPITGFSEKCISFFRDTPDAHLELRTKSTQIRHLMEQNPIPNCVVAYSFTPAPIAKAMEHKTPSVEKRIQCLEKLAEKGWKIGLRFDPLIRAENFQELYQELFTDIFTRLGSSSIHSVSLGPFRLPKPFFKNLIQLYPEESLFAGKMETTDGMVSYPVLEESDMMKWCSEKILEHVSQEQFFPCT